MHPLHRAIEAKTGLIFGTHRVTTPWIARLPLFVGPVGPNAKPDARWTQAWRGAHGVSVSVFRHAAYVAVVRNPFTGEVV